MKKILSISFICLCFVNIFAQECSDIFVSEVFFEDIENPDSRTLTFNHSIELYNPTETPIDLSNYSFELITGTGTNINIPITGTINAASTYVISNALGSSDLLAKTNLLKSTLDFNGKIQISLKHNTDIIDMVGQSITTAGISLIDLSTFLSDPTYLSSINTNLSSIKGLTLKRSYLVKEGSLSWSDLEEQWYIDYANNLDNLGVHFSPCNSVVMSIDPLFIDDIEGTTHTFSILTMGDWSSDPSAIYSYSLDWDPGGSAFPCTDFTPCTWVGAITMPDVYVDNTVTFEFDSNTEPTEYNDIYLSVSGTGASLDPSRNRERLIIRNNTSNSIFNPENISIKIYPNPTSEYFVIATKYDNIKNISIINELGVEVFNSKFEYNKIDITNLQSGLFLVKLFDDNNSLIYTSKLLKK